MGWNVVEKMKNIGKSARKIVGGVASIGAPFATAIGGPVVGGLWGATGKYLTDSVGDSPERNAQKRADFEYARSLADQRAFQDDSIQRRVLDARAAGIHPLAALGFQAPSFTPPQSTYAGGGESEYGLSEMGQDISRAVAAGQTESERKRTMALQTVVDNLSIQRLQLENKGLELENQYRLSRLVRMREGVGPGFPNTNAIRQVGVAELGQGDWVEPGTVPAVARIKNRDGSETDAPSSQAKPLIEDMFPLEAEWYWKNRIVPLVNPYVDKGIRYLEKQYGFGTKFVDKPVRRTGYSNVRQYR